MKRYEATSASPDDLALVPEYHPSKNKGLVEGINRSAIIRLRLIKHACSRKRQDFFVHTIESPATFLLLLLQTKDVVPVVAVVVLKYAITIDC